MKFQVGDKVKFLNEKGGGIVSKILSPTLVNVMVEDGFEIPTMTGELIKVDPKGKVESMFDENFNVRLDDRLPEREEGKPRSQPPESTAEPDRQSPLGNFSFRTKNPPGVYLAFVPHEQNWLVTGPAEIYLVNHTPYQVLFALFLEGEKDIKGKDYDVVFAGHRLLLATVEREELPDWSQGIIQMIFYDEHPTKVYLPSSTNFEVSPSRLSKEENYTETQFIGEKSLIISLAQLSSMTRLLTREDVHLSEEAAMQQKARHLKSGSLIEKHQTGLHEAVVDLHIEELLDQHAAMTPQDMLKYQMDYFKRCIDSAAEKNFRKVTFIHGVGNGTLKNAIIKKLNDYEQMENHLASIAKFGVGAIDVTIRPMK